MLKTFAKLKINNLKILNDLINNYDFYLLVLSNYHLTDKLNIPI